MWGMVKKIRDLMCIQIYDHVEDKYSLNRCKNQVYSCWPLGATGITSGPVSKFYCKERFAVTILVSGKAIIVCFMMMWL